MLITVCLNYDDQLGKEVTQIRRCACEMSVILVGC